MAPQSQKTCSPSQRPLILFPSLPRHRKVRSVSTQSVCNYTLTPAAREEACATCVLDDSLDCLGHSPLADRYFACGIPTALSQSPMQTISMSLEV
jgi:hypothetical protein